MSSRLNPKHYKETKITYQKLCHRNRALSELYLNESAVSSKTSIFRGKGRQIRMSFEKYAHYIKTHQVKASHDKQINNSDSGVYMAACRRDSYHMALFTFTASCGRQSPHL